MVRVGAVISDFGGVLTTPLLGAFQTFVDASGFSLEELGKAMVALTELVAVLISVIEKP